MAKFTVNFTSEALKYPVPIDVIVPADHMVVTTSPLPEKNVPYKTLYILEGVLGNYSGPVNYSHIMQIAEDYNMAVVCVGGDNKWWSNSTASGENYAELVTRDVVNFTRRVFNLSRQREDTFIGGFSMGGYGAFTLGLLHPEIFGYIIALDAALNKGGVIESSNEKTWDLFKKNDYMGIFAVNDVAKYENSENDYEYLAKKAVQEGKPLPKIFMACAIDEPLYPGNLVYRDYLKELGYDVTWFEFVGKHNYVAFDIGMEEAITKWLPVQDNFRENFFYFGPDASTQERGMPWSNWVAWYNVEMDNAT